MTLSYLLLYSGLKLSKSVRDVKCNLGYGFPSLLSEVTFLRDLDLTNWKKNYFLGMVKTNHACFHFNVLSSFRFVA